MNDKLKSETDAALRPALYAEIDMLRAELAEARAKLTEAHVEIDAAYTAIRALSNLIPTVPNPPAGGSDAR